MGFLKKLDEKLVKIANVVCPEPEMPSEEELEAKRKAYKELLKKESICPRCGSKKNLFSVSKTKEQFVDYPYSEEFRLYSCHKCGFNWESKHEQIPLNPKDRYWYMVRHYGIKEEYTL